jgi:hypothetical protein
MHPLLYPITPLFSYCQIAIRNTPVFRRGDYDQGILCLNSGRNIQVFHLEGIKARIHSALTEKSMELADQRDVRT